MMQLSNAELQQFLEEEVRTGRFASVDEAIEAAVMQMMVEERNLPPLDDELEARLLRADEQISRGEYYTIDQVREMFAARVGSRS